MKCPLVDAFAKFYFENHSFQQTLLTMHFWDCFASYDLAICCWTEKLKKLQPFTYSWLTVSKVHGLQYLYSKCNCFV